MTSIWVFLTLPFFSCICSSSWHWILVAVYHNQDMLADHCYCTFLHVSFCKSISIHSAIVLDSMSPNVLMPYSCQTVADINTLLRCWKPTISLKPISHPVSYFLADYLGSTLECCSFLFCVMLYSKYHVIYSYGNYPSRQYNTHVLYSVNKLSERI